MAKDVENVVAAVEETDEELETVLTVLRKKAGVSNGIQYYNYVTECNFNGRKLNINFCPAGSEDGKGYAVLDCVYGDSDELPLVVNRSKMKNDTGKTVEVYSYAVKKIDELGIDMIASIKPIAKSDKDLITYQVKRIEALKRLEREKQEQAQAQQSNKASK